MADAEENIKDNLLDAALDTSKDDDPVLGDVIVDSAVDDTVDDPVNVLQLLVLSQLILITYVMFLGFYFLVKRCLDF